MKDLGIWGLHEQLNSDGRIGLYFKYRKHLVGKFEGSRENAEYMVACINAGLAAWSAIDDAVNAESDPVGVAQKENTK